MVGGGSGINAMLYCRGSASVFDEWAQLSGNKGLGWASMFQAFKATSHWTDESDITYSQPMNTSSFGNGPLEVSRQRELFPLDTPFISTLADKFHLPEIDFVSGGGIGVSQAFNSIIASNRTRSYAHNSFGYRAQARSNYQLVTNAWVTKIGFTGTTADRVTYNDTATGTLVTIQAKEIIVAAGAIKSPQLLLLSGVGPAKALRDLGIKVVADVPGVGQGLIEHHMAIMEFQATSAEPTSWQAEYNATFAAEAAAQYAADGSGWLGKQGGDAFGASRLPDSVFAGTGSSYFPNLPRDRAHIAWGYANLPMLVDDNEGVPNVSTVSAYAAIVQPESRGSVALASADYRAAPVIRSNYWGTASERAAILYAYKQLREVFGAKAIAQYITAELYPGANVTSDEGLWYAIQQTSSSWHHPVNTTSIGTVLSPNWRVKGLRGLRVVGSSAAPQIPTCPIQASIYALAYVAAQDIKRDDRRRWLQ
jgi:choline dehydrogenase-like flavoprotein